MCYLVESLGHKNCPLHRDAHLLIRVQPKIHSFVQVDNVYPTEISAFMKVFKKRVRVQPKIHLFVLVDNVNPTEMSALYHARLRKIPL